MTSKLAFVDNTNTVTMVLNTDESNVEIFTNSIHIVDISTNNQVINVGWTYDGTNFAAPNVILPIPDTPPTSTETTFTPNN
jgi:hypothetical protein